MTSRNGRAGFWISAAVAALAFVVYLLTLSSGAYPGESAALVSRYTGLFMRMTPPRPLWGGLVWVVSRIPLGTVAMRLNLLSAVFGAAAAALVYQIMRRIVLACVEVGDRNRGRAVIASHLAGLTAALSMAFCIPFWVVSTRAHTASFDVLLLLVLARLLLAFLLAGGVRTAVLFAFLYGTGVVEFATLIIMAPLFGGLMLIAMRRYGLLGTRTISGILAAGLGGMLLYLVPPLCFYGSPGYELREYGSFWKIIWIIWRDQYLLIAHSLPRQGWLLVLVLTIVPWLTMLTVARRALNGEKDWAFYILHAVFTGLSIATMFNIPVAPWPMLGMKRLLVTPYVLNATLFGYLTAYWFLLPSNFWPFFAHDKPSARLRWAESLLTVPLLGCVFIAPFLNYRAADGRQSACVNGFAREIVQCLDGRSWLLTDGSLDDQLLIAADELDVPVKLLSLAWNGSKPLMKHVASMFEETGLKNRALIGMMPLLQEWCRSDPEINDKLALFGNPDVLAGCGPTPVPHKLIFIAGGEPGRAEADELMDLHRRFWQESSALLRSGDTVQDKFLAPYCRHVRRHASLVANNLGVIMEDAGAEDNAAEAYREAREIDPENVSALLNLHAMVRQGALRDEDGAIRKELDAFAETMGRQKVGIWSLARDFGYVRTPGAFVDMGWYWAASGRPGMAASGLRKAMDLLPDERRGPLKQALADIYLMQDRSQESEALFYELLVENPRNQRALLGMARIEMARGGEKEAGEYLRRAEEAGVPKTLMALEWATFDVVAGRNEQAVERLESVLSENPRLPRAWALLTGVYIQRNDLDGLENSIRRMESLRLGPNVVLSIARGHLAILKNDLAGAREALEEAARLDQRNIKVLEWLLKLDMIENRETLARSHLELILKLDPDHAFANRILGTLQYAEGEYELAKDSLLRSVRSSKDPQTLNDLAWLLQESGLYEEAEKHVRSSLAMDTKNFHAWDTLGVILMKTRRYAPASEAFEQALSLAGEHTPIMMHKVELLILQGNRPEALAAIESLSLRSGEMTASEAEQLEWLRGKISELR